MNIIEISINSHQLDVVAKMSYHKPYLLLDFPP